MFGAARIRDRDFISTEKRRRTTGELDLHGRYYFSRLTFRHFSMVVITSRGSFVSQHSKHFMVVITSRCSVVLFDVCSNIVVITFPLALAVIRPIYLSSRFSVRVATVAYFPLTR